MNKEQKDQVICLILADTPDRASEIRSEVEKLVTDEAVANMDPKVRAVYEVPALRSHLCHGHVGTPGSLPNVCVPGTNCYEVSSALRSKLVKLGEAYKVARDERYALETKLSQAFAAIRTFKQARALLPEFTAYFDAIDKPKTKQLPATTDLMANLVKAGWPDGKPQQA